MARKRRNKPRTSPTPKPKPTQRDHMARVRVPDEVWADFRAAAGAKPVNLLLGELVQREVDQWRAQRLKEGQLDDRELLDALDRAHELHGNLTRVIARLELRAGRQASAPQASPFDEL